MNIAESIQFILRDEVAVTDLFYTRFLSQYPDVRGFFVDIDLQHRALLRMALSVVEQYYSQRYPAAERYLLVLGHKHHVRGVPEEMYTDWRDCLLDTLARFHAEQWDPGLEDEWKAAVNLATDVMRRGYLQSDSRGWTDGGLLDAVSVD